MSDTADIRLQSATLVLGGARSGKSRHAEALVAAHAGMGGSQGTMIYIATATTGDYTGFNGATANSPWRTASW